MTDRDQHNTRGTPDEDLEADAASGGPPEPPDDADEEDTHDDTPLEADHA